MAASLELGQRRRRTPPTEGSNGGSISALAIELVRIQIAQRRAGPQPPTARTDESSLDRRRAAQPQGAQAEATTADDPGPAGSVAAHGEQTETRPAEAASKQKVGTIEDLGDRAIERDLDDLLLPALDQRACDSPRAATARDGAVGAKELQQ